MNPIIVDARYTGGAIIIDMGTLSHDEATRTVRVQGRGFMFDLLSDEARDMATALMTGVALAASEPRTLRRATDVDDELRSLDD